MKFEKKINQEALEEMVSYDIDLTHKLLDELFMEEEVEAFHFYSGQYTKEYHFAIKGQEYRAVVEYTHKDD